MNIQITGHQISITPAIKEYILQKFAKIQRHYSHKIDAHIVLEVNKLVNKIEITTHLPKKDLHIEVENSDMYVNTMIVKRIVRTRNIIANFVTLI